MPRPCIETRQDLLQAIRERYRAGTKDEKLRILDEFVAITGYHRKHAIRLFKAGSTARRCEPAVAAPRVRCGGARGTRRPVGSLGPGLRQAAQAAAADSGVGPGAPRAPDAGGDGASARAVRQCGDPRPRCCVPPARRSPGSGRVGGPSPPCDGTCPCARLPIGRTPCPATWRPIS